MAFSTAQRGVARLLLYAVGVITIISFVFWSPIPFAPQTTFQGSAGASDQLHLIANGTLGVQKIFAISIPSRLDKRDNIVLGSSLSDFHVEFIDGITPDEINPKTYPYNWNYDHRPVEYAARRAHVNGMQQIVNERLGSAIIMEDDADWDVAIKSQLQSFAIAVRALQGTENAASESPYGHDWDILWLGHCGLECKSDLPSFLTPNDPTILPPHHFLPYWRDPPPLNRPDDSRLTCAISDGVCSIVYAVSFRGAQRILAALSVNPSGIADKIDIGAQFDVSLGRLCGSGYLRCFAPYPSLTGGYRPAAPATKGSDINGLDGDPEKPFDGPIEGPFSNGVMYSTMLNINRILGEEETVLANWDDAPVPEIKPGSIPVIGGSLQAPIAAA
ncbi:uncharacterized protein BJX67DRAFT_246024 [Aspergillus lucknowensis]|uniref:LPS glycosyltransferase n=1 Tax=Aspergillus lucknowensis TaxID=176173 RepID=A0ABR4M270_9EURO